MSPKTLHAVLVSVLIGTGCSALAQSEPDPQGLGEADSESNTGSNTDLPDLDEDASLWGIADTKNWDLRAITLHWENDGTVPNISDDTDEYYTNGTGIELSFDPMLNASLAERLAPSSDWNDPRFGVGIGIKRRIYTPTNLQTGNPQARDHPYGGYLYLSLAFQRADDSKHDHFGLDVGIVGHASGAETTQKWIHNTFPDEVYPQGWETQLSNEPTINASYVRTWKSKKAEIAGLEFEMLPSIGAEAGTVLIAARTQMTARLGYNLPDDFGPPSKLRFTDHTTAATQADGDWSVYGYASLGVDLVFRDMFIDGNAFAGSRSAKREPLVSTVSVGVMARYKAFYLGWTQRFESERFELQPSNHSYGSIVFGYSFDW